MIYIITAKFGQAVFRIAKLNFCFKLVYRITFFIILRNAAPTLGAAKGLVTIPYLKFLIFIDLNLVSFLESYEFSII